MTTKTEFEYQKKLIDLEKKARLEVTNVTHEHRMKEIEADLKSRLAVEASKHEKEMERQRIRNADIQRSKMNRY